MEKFIILAAIYLLIFAWIFVVYKSWKMTCKVRVKLVVYFLINNQKKRLKVMKLNKHKFTEAVLGLVNEKDNSPIEGVQFTEVKIESSDTGVIEIKDADSDGDVDVVPVAVGTAQIKVSAVADYKDPNTGEPVVKGLEADPIDIEVQDDPAKTKLVVSFKDAVDLPVVEEPAGDTGTGIGEPGTGTGTGDAANAGTGTENTNTGTGEPGTGDAGSQEANKVQE